MTNYLSLVFVLFSVLLCSVYSAEIHNKAINGGDAPEGKYPFHAYLTDWNGFLCGATILNKRYLLTAGQCVANIAPSELRVTIGTDLTNDKNATVLRVESATVHEKYGKAGIYADHSVNDIAVIRVRSNIEFNEKVQPVKLPKQDEEVPANASVKFIGMGTLKYGGPYPERLQEKEFKILNHDDCKQIWLTRQLTSIEDNMICTDASVNHGVCKGDSGSPLLADDVQVGIASFGYRCALGMPDVYTRVSDFVDWINEFLQD
ncbi:hypothetical protein TKK_0019294 [Trichogramma kaykai]|uniref:Peptidase S1 domain-containing protein n=1 Tax=Trichogramma kaykai TaxID=54128 RepID=A0ABD2VTI2_9HYME